MVTIKGHFDGTAVVLDEPADLAVGQVVRGVVEPVPAAEAGPWRPSLAGFAKGWFVMSDDFNDPLVEFEDHM